MFNFAIHLAFILSAISLLNACIRVDAGGYYEIETWYKKEELVSSNLELVSRVCPFGNPLLIDFSFKLALEDLGCDERRLRLVETVILIGCEIIR